MTTHRSENAVPGRDEPALPAPAMEAESPDQPDEAALGYGHRAHSPDPAAQYVFAPGEPRVLPVEKKLRWRVPG
jgi:hypothetical protein